MPKPKKRAARKPTPQKSAKIRQLEAKVHRLEERVEELEAIRKAEDVSLAAAVAGEDEWAAEARNLRAEVERLRIELLQRHEPGRPIEQ